MSDDWLLALVCAAIGLCLLASFLSTIDHRRLIRLNRSKP